jgi:hypothetical protein
MPFPLRLWVAPSLFLWPSRFGLEGRRQSEVGYFLRFASIIKCFSLMFSQLSVTFKTKDLFRARNWRAGWFLLSHLLFRLRQPFFIHARNLPHSTVSCMDASARCVLFNYDTWYMIYVYEPSLPWMLVCHQWNDSKSVCLNYEPGYKEDLTSSKGDAQLAFFKASSLYVFSCLLF